MLAVGLINTWLALGTVTIYALVQKFLGFIVLLLGYLVIADTAAGNPDASRKLARTLVLSIFGWNALALASFVLANQLGVMGRLLPGLNTQLRLSGMLVDPNAYGGLLLVGAALLFGSMGGRPLFSRAVSYALGSILILSLALTYSRSAWIGAVVVVLFGLVTAPSRAMRVMLLAVPIVAVVTVAFGQEGMPSSVELATRQDQVNIRLEIIGTALDEFSDAPATGVGLGVFLEQHGYVIHNTPIWVATELGVLGAVLFSGLLWWFTARLWRGAYGSGIDKSLGKGVLLAHLGLVGLSVGIEALYQRHWWAILGVGVGVSLHDERSDRRERSTTLSSHHVFHRS